MVDICRLFDYLMKQHYAVSNNYNLIKGVDMQNSQIKVETEAVCNYAVRRVNPFRGVMQVIEAEEDRALFIGDRPEWH